MVLKAKISWGAEGKATISYKDGQFNISECSEIDQKNIKTYLHDHTNIQEELTEEMFYEAVRKTETLKEKEYYLHRFIQEKGPELIKERVLVATPLVPGLKRSYHITKPGKNPEFIMYVWDDMVEAVIAQKLFKLGNLVHQHGLGPKVIVSYPRGYLTEYVEGHIFKYEDVQKDENQKKLGELLQKLHAIPKKEVIEQIENKDLLKPTLSIYKLVKNLHIRNKSSSTPYPKIFDQLVGQDPVKISGLLLQVYKDVKKFPKTFIHNRINLTNLILCSNGEIQLTNFDNACFADPYLDIAAAGLHATKKNQILTYYLGDTPTDQEKMHYQNFLNLHYLLYSIMCFSDIPEDSPDILTQKNLDKIFASKDKYDASQLDQLISNAPFGTKELGKLLIPTVRQKLALGYLALLLK